ncbi:MAG: hypothetical protein IJA02_10055 [Clostridia bacterium]|nr:hypothetical protein [Clostridia bacterium]
MPEISLFLAGKLKLRFAMSVILTYFKRLMKDVWSKNHSASDSQKSRFSSTVRDRNCEGGLRI